MMYNELVEHCFFQPKHVGVLELNDKLCVYHRNGEAGRGDVIDFYLLCDEKGLILKARFKAYGNPYLIAGAEWLCRQLEGSKINEHPHYEYAFLLKMLDIPQLRYPVALQLEDGYRELVKIMKERLQGEN